MHTTVRGEAHEVEVLAVLLGVAVGSHNLLVLEDAVVGTGAVDLHEVLVYYAAGTDVEVPHLGTENILTPEPTLLKQTLSMPTEFRKPTIIFRI